VPASFFVWGIVVGAALGERAAASATANTGISPLHFASVEMTCFIAGFVEMMCWAGAVLLLSQHSQQIHASSIKGEHL
jgi:hypothetical protein